MSQHRDAALPRAELRRRGTPSVLVQQLFQQAFHHGVRGRHEGSRGVAEGQRGPQKARSYSCGWGHGVRSASDRARPSGRSPNSIGDAGGMADFDALHAEIRDFVAERDWGQYHDPKSLLLALTGEVGELCELFQWLPADRAADASRTDPLHGPVADEIADVLIYLLCLADAVDVDPVAAAAAKLQRSRVRFPVSATSGIAPSKLPERPDVRLRRR